MSNGDHMSLAEGGHVAGMALLLAFAAAFILSSARAAKPADGQDLPEIIQALMPKAAGAVLSWRDLETRLRARWTQAPAGGRPPGLENAAMVRVAQVPMRLPAEGARRRADNWQIMAWGSSQSASAFRVSRDGESGATDLEQALVRAGVPFMIECETAAVRHYRLTGSRPGHVAHYGARGQGPEILVFWGAPPEALLRRDGCLITSARR